MIFLLIIVVAYLSGSVPSAVWIGRMVRGIDTAGLASEDIIRQALQATVQ